MIIHILTITYVVRSGSKSTKNTCLLLGIPNSGKTALFFRLKDDQVKSTHTSMKENEATFALNGKELNLVDVPGHPRVRVRYQHYIPVTGCIVFLVDTIDVSSNVNLIGEFLFDLLTNANIVKRRIPILIACNKTDVSVHNKDYVKKQLEVELNKIRSTRTSQMTMQQEVDSNVVDLVEDVQREFTFDEDSVRTDVQFVDCSVTKKPLTSIVDFIGSNI
jgi:signal recognition particle receptor subunit beta